MEELIIKRLAIESLLLFYEQGEYIGYSNSELSRITSCIDKIRAIPPSAPRLQEAAEWVRVEDGLPEESGYILAYDENKVFPTQMRWYDVGFELKQVCTHWRPLPAPPKPNNEMK